ncbi:MAG TPA: hypothetical protein VMZ03_07795 [Chitinophagaceae bacterium]|nr:hypothetical protein [Chitinophagaceae bacterium]
MIAAFRYMLLICAGAILVSSGCKKNSGGGGGGGGTSEANLAVTTNPSNGSVQAPSIGPFDLAVTITSVMPPSGVKIEVTAKKDDGTNPPPFFSQTVNTSVATTLFSITNTPLLTQCIVEIKVTSLTKSTNTWTGSYRYSRK